MVCINLFKITLWSLLTLILALKLSSLIPGLVGCNFWAVGHTPVREERFWVNRPLPSPPPPLPLPLHSILSGTECHLPPYPPPRGPVANLHANSKSKKPKAPCTWWEHALLSSYMHTHQFPSFPRNNALRNENCT